MRRVPAALALVLALLAVLAVTATPRSARAGGLPWGVDVASYQHPGGAGIDWGAVHRGGASFAIVKATEGTGYVSPWFAGDWAGARNAGLVRGAYAFARPALPISTAADQARRFVQVVGTTREAGDLPPILDLEVNGGLNPGQVAQWTQTYLVTIEALTGRIPVIYTGQYFWRDQVGNAGGFTGYPLWLAAYQKVSPRAPYAGGWNAWTMWQYTSTQSVAGIRGGVDASQFAGTAAQLAAFADGRDTLISRRYTALGGAAGVLGAPTAPEAAFPGGFGQTFAHGAIVQTGSAVHVVYGATGERYLRAGAWNGGLGVPVSDTARIPAGDYAAFAGGGITAQRGHPAYVIPGAIWTRYNQARGSTGALGWATGEARAVGHGASAAPLTSGTEQLFAGGAIIGSRAQGTHVVAGPILDLYQALGGADGVLGLPTNEQHAGTVGPQIDFQVGSIAYSTALKRAVLL